MIARFARAATGVSLVLLFGCGEGTVTFGSGDDDNPNAKLTIKGTLDSVSPVTTRDIVVFVYNISDGSDRCPCPPDPSNSTSGNAVVLASGQTDFTVPSVDSGKIGVVFLLDNAGTNADGEIDPGDPIAILDDTNCDLDDVKSGLTVTLSNVDLLFSSAPTSDCTNGTPPAEGRARANQITKTRVTP